MARTGYPAEFRRRALAGLAPSIARADPSADPCVILTPPAIPSVGAPVDSVVATIRGVWFCPVERAFEGSPL